MIMKISWGTGIVIAFALFMGFILFFVLRVQSDHQYDNELVVEDYYKQERLLQLRLDKEQNAASLPDKVHSSRNCSGACKKRDAKRPDKVKISTAGDTLKIMFPKGFDPKQIQGTVSLYRPSSEKLDFEITISLSSHDLLIPKSDLAGGRWDIIIDWRYKGRPYLNTEMLTLP